MVTRMDFNHYAKPVKFTAMALALLLLLWAGKRLIMPQNGLVLPPPSVTVQKPVLKEMVDYVTQTGTTVAYNSVDLVARVEGYLQAIEFTDGTMVEKGRELFVIQPEPYMEKLKAAQATVAAQKAGYDYALSEYARQQRMYKENATSLNNVEKWLARTKEVKAEIDKAVADEEIAAINYGYTHVSAPFYGRIGRHLVDIGNLVGNGQATVLATLEQVAPIYVYFNLNELDLIRLRNAALAEGFKPGDIKQVVVDITMQNSTKRHHANLDFVNTGLNASTGTMELRAVLPNADYLFVPGLFVQVHLPVSKPQMQLTVPETAILSDQIGPYLLLVDADSKVVLRRVSVGSASDGVRAITKGLAANERVIVDGLQNATPGNLVNAEDASPPAPSPSTTAVKAKPEGKTAP
ncbi:efflux RND transporter periplasmic adaptor subunit [Legionella geestiana]|nr:efflux RND transporter periplasmic adaptor subunit [Legionella geestiana]